MNISGKKLFAAAALVGFIAESNATGNKCRHPDSSLLSPIGAISAWEHAISARSMGLDRCRDLPLLRYGNFIMKLVN